MLMCDQWRGHQEDCALYCFCTQCYCNSGWRNRFDVFNFVSQPLMSILESVNAWKQQSLRVLSQKLRFFSYTLWNPSGKTRTFDLDFRYAFNCVSCYIGFTFCFHLACQQPNLACQYFPLPPFLMYKKGAILRMIPYWCHVKSSLITLMFDLVIVTGKTSTT